MGRPAEPPDRAATSLAEFAVGLQALRLAAGSPSFEELGRVSGQPAVELAAAVSGRIVPSFAITLAFVRACRGDENQWARRWHILQERLGEEADRAAERLGGVPDVWAQNGWVQGAPEAPGTAWPAAEAPGVQAPGGGARGFGAPGTEAPGFGAPGAGGQHAGVQGAGAPGDGQGAAASQAAWLNVTPADEWLAMASSLPSGEPLPTGDPGGVPTPDSWVAGPGRGAEPGGVPGADPRVAHPGPGRESAAGPAAPPWAAPTAADTERQWRSGARPDARPAPGPPLPPTPHKDFRPPSWRPEEPPPPVVHEDRDGSAKPQPRLAPDPGRQGAATAGPAKQTRVWDPGALAQPRAPGERTGPAGRTVADGSPAEPGGGREAARASAGTARSAETPGSAGIAARPPAGGRAASGGRARPGRPGPRPTRVGPPGRGPRGVRGSRSPRRPHSPLLAGILAAFAVAALGFGYLMFFHHGQPGQAGQMGQAGPTQQAPPSATSRHPTAHPTARGSPRVTPSTVRASATATPGVAQFPALAGVGCRPGTGISAVTGTRGPGGDGWLSVRGGLPACGGRALATRKTGTAGLAQDTFTWTFRVGRPATCTAQIFIANTNPSSGLAHYSVYGDSLGPGASIGAFVIDQGGAKGQWVQEGPWRVRDVLHIQLTDAAAFPGDMYHVTASAARASCS